MTPDVPITLDPHPAEGHSSQYTLAVAAAIGQAAPDTDAFAQ